MDGIDISSFDLDVFEGFGSSVQKFLDGSLLDGDYFNLDMYETASDLSDVSLEAGTNEPKRKRKRNLEEAQQCFKLARPRIVKSDFRRTFPQMWASVFNSTSYETMRSHISAFYDKNVAILQQDMCSGTVNRRTECDCFKHKPNIPQCSFPQLSIPRAWICLADRRLDRITCQSSGTDL